MSLPEAVGNLRDIIVATLRAQFEHKFGASEETESHIRSVQKILEEEPEELQDREEVVRAYAALARQRDLLRELVGGRAYHDENTFSTPIDAVRIDQHWQGMYNSIREALGPEEVSEPTPTGPEAGYVAARIADLASNHRAPGLTSPIQFLDKLAHALQSPHLLRAILGALLCGWLFAGEEPICKDVYSIKELHLHQLVLQSRKYAANRTRRIDIDCTQEVPRRCNTWTRSV